MDVDSYEGAKGGATQGWKLASHHFGQLIQIIKVFPLEIFQDSKTVAASFKYGMDSFAPYYLRSC